MHAKGSTTKLPRTCLNCGQTFLVHLYKIRKGEGKFCSQSCSTSHRTQPPVIQSCVRCGTTFHAKRSAKRRYCSHSCYVAHHHGESVEDRFWSKVDRRGPDDCWEWQAGSFEEGYGAFMFRGTLWKASRVAWTLTHGDIPNDLWVLHECDNPPCCNPAHLFLGTHIDNVADMVSKNRVCRTSGSDRWVSKLDEPTIIGIRQRYAAGGVTQQELADEFGVSFQNISMIVLRKTWKHVV